MAGSINVNDYWVNQGQIPTLGDVEDGIEQATIEGLDATNMAAGFSGITIASSAPAVADGKAWIDTTSLAGAPELKPKIYNSVSTEWLGWNILYQATAPSTTTTGWLWYDMDAKLLRVYRATAYDPAGIAGWHPVSEQYQLWKNSSGGIIGSGRPVVLQTGSERAFTTSAIGKDCTVVGVTLVTIASAAYGIVATVAGGACVDVLLDTGPGNVAIGDGIATHSSAGRARTVGALPTNSTAAAAVMHTGIPLGCFAVALEAATALTLTACKLLGQVGSGSTYRKAATTIAGFTTGLADANWDGGWDAVNVADYPPTTGTNDFIADAKHKPIAAVILSVDAAGGTTNAGGGQMNLTLSFGKDASTALAIVDCEEIVNNTIETASVHSAGVIVPTAGVGTPTVMGNAFYWKGDRTASAGTPVMTQARFKATGYIYALLIGLSLFAGGV